MYIYELIDLYFVYYIYNYIAVTDLLFILTLNRALYYRLCTYNRESPTQVAYKTVRVIISRIKSKYLSL